jgi:tryptophanyl-tRNA synthetase
VQKAIFEKFMERFGPARRRREELKNQPDFVEEALRRGVEKARAVGVPLVRQVRESVGIPNS